MLEYILIGAIAAVVVVIPPIIFYVFPQIIWIPPALIVSVAALLPVAKKFLSKRIVYEASSSGFGRLMENVHNPSHGSTLQWFFSGLMSFLLVFFGGCVGPEGAGIEFGYATLLKLRTRSGLWFEQRRRTDSAASFAAGLSATFASPFSGILLPIELCVGGQSIAVAATSISAFAATIFLRRFVPIDANRFADEFAHFDFFTARMVLNAVLIGIASGVASCLSVHFIRYIQNGLRHLFQSLANARVVVAFFLLYIIFLIFDPAYTSPWTLLRQVMWSRHSVGEVGLIFVLRLLSLSVVLASFGTLGIFWPIFLLGGIIGFTANQFAFSFASELTPGACLLGGAIFFGTFLRAPLTASVLALELTLCPEVVPLVALGGGVAKLVNRLLRSPVFLDEELKDLGISLIDGRSITLLSRLRVRDAMASDYESAHQHDSIAILYRRVQESKYPFLPIVDAENRFLGILTLEVIEEKWKLRSEQSEREEISELIQAKDMLYRSNFEPPTIQATDFLSATVGRFDEFPCLTVLDDQNRVVGLLLVYHVRLAYDQEMIKRSFRASS